MQTITDTTDASDEERKIELHKSILDAYEEDHAHFSEVYEQMEQDIEFQLNIENAQWDDGRIYEQNKLKLAINKCEAECDAIINEMRSTRPSIRTLPADDGADIDTSDVIKGLIRNIETISDAETAYDTAANFQVPAGLGFLRVNLEWIENTFDQEPRILPVQDFTSVIMDRNTRALDGSDQSRCTITEIIREDEFIKEYPDAQPIDFTTMNALWQTEKNVVIAEHFYKICEYETIYQVQDKDPFTGMPTRQIVMTQAQIDEYNESAKPIGELEIINQRKQKVDKIKWCKLNGQEILEETEWLGQYIPIVPVYGKMTFIKGERIISGLIKNLRDPQKLLNYTESYNTETVALSPKSPFMGYDEVFAGYESQYKQANNKNLPFLMAKAVVKNGVLLPPPQRQPGPMINPAMQQQTMLAMQHMKSVTGKIYDEGQESLGAESGKAILAKERKADIASYHFVDNQSKSIRMVGKILVDLIPKVYSGERIVRILGEDGTDERVPVNQPTKIKKDGQEIDGIYRLDAGKYDVVVNVGPSFASKRQEALEASFELARIMPQIMGVGADLIVSNIDAPGMDDLAKRLKKALPPGVADDEQNPEQIALMQAQQAVEVFKGQLAEMEKRLEDKTRSENMDFAIKKEQNRIKEQEAQIKAFEAQIDAYKVQAEANNIPAEAFSQIVAAISELKEQNDDVTTAISLLLDADEGDPSPPSPSDAPI